MLLNSIITLCSTFGAVFALPSDREQTILNVKALNLDGVFAVPSWIIPQATPSSVLRSEKQQVAVLEDPLTATYVVNKDFYQIQIDSRFLDPQSIQLSILDLQTLQVEARQKYVSKFGKFTYRDVKEKFVVPLGYDVEKLLVDIDERGVLSITIPHKGEKAVGNNR